MTKILITGATGKVGSAVTAELQSKGISFKAMVRNPDKAQELNNQGVETIAGDFADPLSYRSALDNVQKVFLLVPPDENMAQMECDFIDACKEADVEHIVNISAVGTARDSPLNLGQFHYRTEEHLKASGIAYTILRPHSFMQNLLGNIGTVKAQSSIYSSAGDVGVPMIDARDVGAVAAAVLTNPGHENEVYHVTGSNLVTQPDIASAISEAVGREITYVPVPDEAAHQAMVGMGLPPWLADDLVGMTRFWREGHGVAIDPIAEQILGRSTRTVQDFIQDHVFLFR
ncbi:MAG: SDR family oxidoreductase [Saprospiraceae bacterium]|nr:SDR family oxidoreductase [Saprospiraceae bacterium]